MISHVFTVFCSGDHESEMRVLFNIKEEGELTPKLSAFIPGETIWGEQGLR